MAKAYYKSVTGKAQVTVRMTERFTQDLNLIMASYGLADVSYVIRESVARQADAIRERMAGRMAPCTTEEE